MKSLVVMLVGLGIVLWGFYHLTQEKELDASKWYYIVGGAVLFVGMIINHWEHTRLR